MGRLFENPVLLFMLLLLLVLLFGAKRLPDAARGLGRSLRIFKAETEGLRSDATAPAPTATPDASAAPRPIAATPVAPPAPIADPAPSADAPRVLIDPVTGEQVLAQPVQQPPAQS